MGESAYTPFKKQYVENYRYAGPDEFEEPDMAFVVRTTDGIRAWGTLWYGICDSSSHLSGTDFTEDNVIHLRGDQRYALAALFVYRATVFTGDDAVRWYESVAEEFEQSIV